MGVIGSVGRFRLLSCALAVAALGVGGPAALAAGREAQATKVGAAPAAQRIQLVLPLKADEAGLERLAEAITSKGSPEYGQYESISELARRFGASASTSRRVIDYLKAAGATHVKVDVTGLFADATMSVGLAQRLFDAPLARFRAEHNVRFIAPVTGSRVPAAIRGLVTGVVGLDTRPLVGSPKPLVRSGWPRDTARTAQAMQRPSGYFPRTGTATGCPAGLGTLGFTPNQYLAAYGYTPLRRAGMSGRGERVALIEIDGFRYSDILTFSRCFGLRIPPIGGYGVGFSRPLAPGGEATLDLEVLDATAPDLKKIDVYESKSAAADLVRSLTAPLGNLGAEPQVISASLGVCEPALKEFVGSGGINAAQGALSIAAASGITYVASSGDSGSAACPGSNGPADLAAVNYPASSAWVTGVGGTNFLLNDANQILAQFVWNDAPVQIGASGGGFSGEFPRPAYQKAVVSQNHRAVPDVSMLADVAPGYAIFCSAGGVCINGQNSDPWLTVGGTSAATPLLAGGIALVDQYLRRRGRQDLGLINPMLYSIGGSSLASKVFDDVTLGENDVGPFLPGSNGRPLGCCSAKVGYDEASGWGSVNLSTFAQVAASVDPKIVNVKLSLPGHQRPVSQRQLLATVSCSGRCLMGAYAEVGIGRAKPIEVDSNVYLLRSGSHKTISIKLPRAALGKLRTGLSRGSRIVATVYGVTVDAAGAIEKRTGAKRLTISS